MTVAPLCADSCGNSSGPRGDSGGSLTHCDSSGPPGGSSCNRGPSADSTSCCCLSGGGGFVLCEKSGRNAWPNEVYSHQQIEQLQYRLFGDILLPCPGNPELYLDRTYGKNWRTVGSTHSVQHRTEKLYQADRFQLTRDMMEPAAYSDVIHIQEEVITTTTRIPPHPPSPND